VANVLQVHMQVINLTSHYDCVNAGYAVAQSTFRNLEQTEEFNRDYIEQSKLVIKFECKELGAKT
jgi:hypothetical protein